ncbi:MAG TPA: universal stress protein [Candidatus Tectomicrobia bacterium]|jgi:nucleotide-binding universal stress UspA family protein|nr:universal stress protein [Candidatus Tectomicrobia bacterium]
MYKRIFIPVDNSEHSNRCVDIGVTWAQAFGATLIGSHVYAAKMHDYRFKQMEYTLPEEYQDEKELERQRKIHDSLITMGLQLISDSYLDVMERRAGEAGIPFERRTYDGRTFQPLVDDIRGSQYDLVILGALGMGAVKDSLLGSVCERVVRRVNTDTLVVKDVRPWEEQQTGSIVVGVDGSPQSFAALKAALALGKVFRRPIEAVAVYDPYLHYAMFNSIVGVLNDQAAKIFRFKEQEQLHEEIIDTGLARIYQSHLEIAKKLAAEEGVELNITLHAGKAFEKLLDHTRQVNPWLLIVGKIGVHSDDSMDIGGNAENLLRMAPCHVMLVSGKYYPPLDVKAEESINWTKEALQRMERVPAFVRGIARTAVLRHAIEKGHSIVSSSVIDEVMAIFMPQKTAAMAESVAEQLALQQLQAEGTTTFICEVCGYVAKGADPVKCPVCGSGAERFVKLDLETVEAIVAEEGGAEAEETFDGLTLRWTLEAKEELRRVPVAYMRRRAKARVEKTARVRKLTTITRDFVLPIVRESIAEAEAIGAAPKSGQDGAANGRAPTNGGSAAEPAPSPAVEAVQLGAFSWTQDALNRLNRVPEGFMRDMTREKIEEYARQHEASLVTLEVAEKGIEVGRQLMAEMIAGYSQAKKEAQEVNGHQAESTATPVLKPSVLNEVPSVQGTLS